MSYKQRETNFFHVQEIRRLAQRNDVKSWYNFGTFSSTISKTYSMSLTFY